MLKTFCWRQQNHISIVFSYVWKKYSKWQQLQKTINIPRKRKHKMDCRCGRDRHENIFIDQQNSTFHDAKDMSKALKCCLRKTICHRRRWRRRRSGKFQLVFDAIHEHKKKVKTLKIFIFLRRIIIRRNRKQRNANAEKKNPRRAKENSFPVRSIKVYEAAE